MQTISPYRPSSGRFAATFPQGKAIFRIAGRFSGSQRSHPLRHLRCHLPLHAGRQTPRRFRRMEFERAGHAAAPTHKIESASRPSSVFASQSHLPPGEGIPQKDVTLLHRPTVHPLRLPLRAATSPYTPGGSAPPEEFPQIRKNHPVSKNFEAGWCFFLREIRIFFTSWTGKRRWRQRPSCLRPWPE